MSTGRAANIVIALIGLIGLGVKLSEMIVGAAGSSLLLALALTALGLVFPNLLTGAAGATLIAIGIAGQWYWNRNAAARLRRP